MKIILFGPPGSGKGTQAELLKEKEGFLHFSTGDFFRQEIAKETSLGKKVQYYLEKGLLVPDEIVIEIVENFLKENYNKKIVFDGYPRTLPQAFSLDQFLLQRNEKINFCFLIELSEEEIIKRLTSRRVCKNCGAIYNLNFKKPKIEGLCDLCNSELIQRDDDKEEVIKERINIYYKDTLPLIDYYEKKNNLYRIKGDLGKDYVYSEIIKKIKNYGNLY
ncbi:MAG: adenylate kinase [candidate division WOR-3 bacterium]|nr:adenylate kinase [candidate division WOR-3 bacterium]MCX7837612.1 adenylate kinase [candidate division WOR-3 bacterium]MDW8113353.1 adenylate kinase [candidate division WOR-3 bacterium]